MTQATGFIKNMAFWGLIVGGVVLLVMAGLDIARWQENERITTKIEEAKYKVIDVKPEILAAELIPFQRTQEDYHQNIRGSDYLTLFILDSQICVPCITEVYDFLNIFNTDEARYITPWVVVTDSDSTTAKAFLENVEFSAPMYYGSSSIVDSLLTYIDGSKMPKMFAVIDLSEGAIIYRTSLSSRVTSPHEKLSIMKEAGLVKINQNNR